MKEDDLIKDKLKQLMFCKNVDKLIFRELAACKDGIFGVGIAPTLFHRFSGRCEC